jgi:uncharacterized metal-binding protein YceD (DUF177 family)
MIGVHLRQIPPEGKHLEGQEDASCLDLGDIGAKPVGPVTYALEVGLSGGGVFATGQVAVPVEMACVACLQPFTYVAKVENFASQVQLDGRELVDLTPSVREELLLALPNHPRCDLNPGQSCPYRNPDVSGGGSQKSTESAWDQLDKLKLKR